MNNLRIDAKFTAPALLALAALAGCSSTPTQQAAPAAQTASAPQAPAQPAPTASTAPTQSVKAVPVAVPTGSVYFDYDQSVIKDQYAGLVRAYADYLQKKGGGEQLEGNCDERGSREYNMALGQKRADAVKRALTALGVKGERVETVSYGEDKPKAKGHDEAAWAENRRVDLVGK